MRRIILALVIATAASVAQDIYVSPGGSIQAAIVQAVNGSRIFIQPGVYTEQIDFLGKAIEVIGRFGASMTTIDGGGSGPVVQFTNGEGTSSRLRGLTISGGFVALGAGGIAVGAGATPTIEDCIIRSNGGKYGAGVSGSPILRRCSIINNVASVSHGGGLYGAPQLFHCVVAGNTCTSGSGGGLYLIGGSATIEDCVFAENCSVLTGGKGGGIYIKSTAAATIRRSVFVANFTTAGNFNALGAGIAVEGAGTTVESCVFVGNLLNGNTQLGGAIWGPATVRNTIVRDNATPQLSGVASVSYSDVQGGFAGTGNFDLPPLFVSQANRDYHLLPGSPAIDAGDPLLLDPDGTTSDVGAFPFETLYTRANTRMADWDAPSWPEVSAVVGGRQVLVTLGTPLQAGHAYLTMGSVSGTMPGVLLLGTIVPLNPDSYTLYTITYPNTSLLAGSLGALDANGRASTVFTLPADPQGTLAGLTVNHATIAGTAPPLALTFTSQASTLAIVP